MRALVSFQGILLRSSLESLWASFFLRLKGGFGSNQGTGVFFPKKGMVWLP